MHVAWHGSDPGWCDSDRVFPRIVKMGYQAVRTERWKYIRYLELDGMDEFYDLKADPYETRNLVSQPHAQQTLKRMRKELGQLLKQTSARESSSATRLKQPTAVSK